MPSVDLIALVVVFELALGLGALVALPLWSLWPWLTGATPTFGLVWGWCSVLVLGVGGWHLASPRWR